MKKKSNLLIVGSDENFDSLEERLSEYEVTRTGKKEEALRLLEGSEEARCIISEYELEDGNGLELLSQIDELDNHIPFIMYTGNENGVLASKVSKSARPTSYLIKNREDIEGVVSCIEKQIQKGNKCLKNEMDKRKLEALIESSAAGIIVTSFDNKIKFSNEKFGDMLGYEVNNLIGKHVSEITPNEELKELKRETEKRKEGIETTYESKMKRKDGSERDILIDGSPYQNLAGNYEGTVGIITDITEKKKRKERINFLHSLLRHDVKNKIQVAKGYSEMIGENTSGKLKGYIEKVESAIENGIDVIEKVRKLIHVREERVEKVKLNPIIKDVVNQYENSFNLDINFEEDFESVVLGGALLKESFSNLIDNSVKHSEGNSVRVSKEETNEEVRVTVEDNGKGIEDKLKERIFDKEYKGKKSTGTGTGLYLTKKIIDHYDGRIEVENSELGGAQFDIYLKKPN